MLIIDDGPTGIWDRIIGALLAFVLVALTLSLLPIALIFKTHSSHPYFLFKFSRHLYSIVFFVWVGFVSLLSLLYGALFGTTSVISMLSHLWGTSSDCAQTYRVWAIAIICGLITLSFFVNWEYLLS